MLHVPHVVGSETVMCSCEENDLLPRCSGASKLEDAKENSSGLQKQNSDQRKVQGGDDEVMVSLSRVRIPQLLTFLSLPSLVSDVVCGPKLPTGSEFCTASELPIGQESLRDPLGARLELGDCMPHMSWVFNPSRSNFKLRWSFGSFRKELRVQ